LSQSVFEEGGITIQKETKFWGERKARTGRGRVHSGTIMAAWGVGGV